MSAALQNRNNSSFWHILLPSSDAAVRLLDNVVIGADKEGNIAFGSTDMPVVVRIHHISSPTNPQTNPQNTAVQVTVLRGELNRSSTESQTEQSVPTELSHETQQTQPTQQFMLHKSARLQLSGAEITLTPAANAVRATHNTLQNDTKPGDMVAADSVCDENSRKDSNKNSNVVALPLGVDRSPNQYDVPKGLASKPESGTSIGLWMRRASATLIIGGAALWWGLFASGGADSPVPANATQRSVAAQSTPTTGSTDTQHMRQLAVRTPPPESNNQPTLNSSPSAIARVSDNSTDTLESAPVIPVDTTPRASTQAVILAASPQRTHHKPIQSAVQITTPSSTPITASATSNTIPSTPPGTILGLTSITPSTTKSTDPDQEKIAASLLAEAEFTASPAQRFDQAKVALTHGNLTQAIALLSEVPRDTSVGAEAHRLQTQLEYIAQETGAGIANRDAPQLVLLNK